MNQEISTKYSTLDRYENEKKDKIYLEELQVNQKENDSINGSNRKTLKEKDSINQNKLLKFNRNEKYLENIIKIFCKIWHIHLYMSFFFCNFAR